MMKNQITIPECHVRETELLERIKSISREIDVPVDNLLNEAILMLLEKYEKTS